MSLSTDVKLKKDVVPVWPERCVGCGAAEPQDRVSIKDRSTTLLSSLTMQFAPKVVVVAPACSACATRIQRRHLIERGLMLVTIAAGIFLGYRFVAPDRSSIWQTPIIIACALGAYAPVVAWRILMAPRFGIQAWGDDIDYEFADEAYAREFAALNGGRAT